MQSDDTEGLHEIANTANADRKADIVFVHGLSGSSHSTWRHGKEGEAGHFFWPEELGKDLPECGIWTVGYSAGLTAFGKPGMSIELRAGNLSQKLANVGIGTRPLVFITHSMGGLVVKSLIAEAQALPDTDRKRLVDVIRAIVFCGTPHRGAGLADAAGVLGKFFGGTQGHVDEMRANSVPLDTLHDKFIEWHRNRPIPVCSYAETIGLYRKNWYFRMLPLGLVVPRASANPTIAGHTVHDVGDDHLTLVKPPNRQHDVYAGVLRFIRDALPKILTETANVRGNIADPPKQADLREQNEGPKKQKASPEIRELGVVTARAAPIPPTHVGHRERDFEQRGKNLLLSKIASKYQAELEREAGHATMKTRFQFDGIVRNKDRLSVVEVKYLRTGSFSGEVFEPFLSRAVKARSELPSDEKLRFSVIIVVATDLRPQQTAPMRQVIANIVGNYPFRAEIEIFNWDDLTLLKQESADSLAATLSKNQRHHSDRPAIEERILKLLATVDSIIDTELEKQLAISHQLAVYHTSELMRAKMIDTDATYDNHSHWELTHLGRAYLAERGLLG